MQISISERTLISAGDFIDLYFKIRKKGLKVLLPFFKISGKKRSVTKWDNVTSSSDFWIIPEVRKRWNKKCTGNPDVEYEDYLVDKYFPDSGSLKMLSVGCGTGARDRKFGKYQKFSIIEGIDQASSKIQEARALASESGLNNIKYYTGDFRKAEFEKNSYDLILFNSSLHHFNKIEQLIKFKVLPLLKEGGYLVIFEYVGPRRLQLTNFQLKFANGLYKELPDRYKTRVNSAYIRKKIYRPGLIRMLLVDPSEAVESDLILPNIHRHFKIIEEKNVGWDILHFLLKDISHNFLGGDNETTMLLNHLFDQEDAYMDRTGRSDAVFGVYKK